MTTNQQNSDSNSNNGKKLFYTKIPPDGGWGWIIVIGYSLFNVRKKFLVLNIIYNLVKSFGFSEAY